MDFIMKTLRMRLSTQATYMVQHKDECHEATRDRILLRLNKWLTVPSETERCWWITGKPGVGKSAIAITVADCLTARRPVSATAASEDGYVPKATLFGQFFINLFPWKRIAGVKAFDFSSRILVLQLRGLFSSFQTDVGCVAMLSWSQAPESDTIVMTHDCSLNPPKPRAAYA